MSEDIEFNVGLIAVTMRPEDVDFTGVSVASGRAGVEQSGRLREAVIESSDGLRMTVGCTVWTDGSADVQPLDFLAGPDPYRRLEAAGRMTLGEAAAGRRVALLRTLKYGDRGYPTLASVTWDDLNEVAGTDVAELLTSHGAVAIGEYGELKGGARQHAGHPAFMVDEGGVEAVFAAYATTRVLPIMKRFGIERDVEALY
ncbi:hypothetical protein [Microbacterium rhizosphaerae]|uniref:Uncharacterized protein n=1 Tax=Microbacterium rhizosphaerae TaxID=1678237 RepID=A0ABZ0SIA0_9MICO|nr:hypothetical protein [Microbacterium rhizosphaerae]WPR88733.1 hypothetical protein SM116_13275 [Microbacterium rhizosphaerae]